MTRPRSVQIDLSATPYYHIMTRCVRRSYLCGMDSLTGKDYNHRKTWLVEKMKTLGSIFSINIAAYGIMSNHYHLVLHVDKKTSDKWSYEEIKKRWALVFPSDAEKFSKLEKKGELPVFLRDKYDLWRERLSSISWFMRCLNEPIARMANFEDDCTGRFWEGRFKSQALLSDGAVLSAMAYVDLNPIRAGMAQTLETSEFTSIHERIHYAINEYTQSKKKNKIKRLKPSAWTDELNEVKQPPQLMPFSKGEKSVSLNPAINFSFKDYLYLVDSTGRVIRSGKRGYISNEIKPILERLNLDNETWFLLVNSLEKCFSYQIGQKQISSLVNKINRQNKSLLKKAA